MQKPWFGSARNVLAGHALSSLPKKNQPVRFATTVWFKPRRISAFNKKSIESLPQLRLRHVDDCTGLMTQNAVRLIPLRCIVPDQHERLRPFVMCHCDKISCSLYPYHVN